MSWTAGHMTGSSQSEAQLDHSLNRFTGAEEEEDLRAGECVWPPHRPIREGAAVMSESALDV